MNDLGIKGKNRRFLIPVVVHIPSIFLSSKLPNYRGQVRQMPFFAIFLDRFNLWAFTEVVKNSAQVSGHVDALFPTSVRSRSDRSHRLALRLKFRAMTPVVSGSYYVSWISKLKYRLYQLA